MPLLPEGLLCSRWLGLGQGNWCVNPVCLGCNALITIRQSSASSTCNQQKVRLFDFFESVCKGVFSFFVSFCWDNCRWLLNHWRWFVIISDLLWFHILPPEHQSQNGMFYTKISPIIGLGYLKVFDVENIV